MSCRDTQSSKWLCTHSVWDTVFILTELYDLVLINPFVRRSSIRACTSINYERACTCIFRPNAIEKIWMHHLPHERTLRVNVNHNYLVSQFFLKVSALDSSHESKIRTLLHFFTLRASVCWNDAKVARTVNHGMETVAYLGSRGGLGPPKIFQPSSFWSTALPRLELTPLPPK